MKKLFKNKTVIVFSIILLLVIVFSSSNIIKQKNLYISETERFNDVSEKFDKAENREEKIKAYYSEKNFEVSEDLNSSKSKEFNEDVMSEVISNDLNSLTKFYADTVSKLTLKDAANATYEELSASIKGLREVNKTAKSEDLLNSEDLKTFTSDNLKLIKEYKNQIYVNKISSLNKKIENSNTSDDAGSLKDDAKKLKGDISKDSELTEDSRAELDKNIDKTIKSAESKYNELKDKEAQEAEQARLLAEQQAEAQRAAYVAPSNSYSGGSSSSSSTNSGSSSNSENYNSSGSSSNNSYWNGDLELRRSDGGGYTDGEPYAPDDYNGTDNILCVNGYGCDVVGDW